MKKKLDVKSLVIGAVAMFVIVAFLPLSMNPKSIYEAIKKK